ncbi:MAG: ferredoxin family protein [Planctomycetes bacterium]|nr:ferredoxin family protein [Planctomycetota bacterium]
MNPSKLTVVLSQAQGQHPVRRHLEENLASALLLEHGIDVSVIPHLYDLTEDHTGMLFLRSITGDIVVLSWLYPRAAHWMLDRHGVKGKPGEARLAGGEEEEEEEEEVGPASEDTEAIGDEEKPKPIEAADVPDRYIYTLDLRQQDRPEPYLEEIRRIAAECLGRRKNTLSEGHSASRAGEMKPRGFIARESIAGPAASRGNGRPGSEQLLATPARRRWYPVIDFSRCTNCMECIDFCLFGVYGVDAKDRILVENPDNCKKGCPACSRVCPEHAIIFPEYKTPAIAGANLGSISGLKIDLTRFFGGDDALSLAAKERDRELVRDGRSAVGLTAGIPKRQGARNKEGPRDELDQLMDKLDKLDL